MNTDQLKSTLVTLAKEKPQAFRALIDEVLAESVQQQARDSRLETMKKLIEADFEQYDDVFRKLA